MIQLINCIDWLQWFFNAWWCSLISFSFWLAINWSNALSLNVFTSDWKNAQWVVAFSLLDFVTIPTKVLPWTCWREVAWYSLLTVPNDELDFAFKAEWRLKQFQLILTIQTKFKVNFIDDLLYINLFSQLVQVHRGICIWQCK